MSPKQRIFSDGEAEGILDYGAVPDMLGIRSVPDSTILAPEIMVQLQTDLSSIGEKAQSYMSFEVATLSNAGRYFGAQLQFVSSLIESIYQKNPALYNRMIMHSTTQMLLNKDVFVGFMLFQFYLLRKAIVRDNENEKKIMRTNNPDDIDISAIQDQLRRNACILLFVKNDGFSTAFPVQDFTQNLFPVTQKPSPKSQIFGVVPEKIARLSVPEYADAEDRHGAFVHHIDTLFPPGRKHDAALLTHIGGDLLPQDPIELLMFLGDTVIFNYPEGGPSQVLVVKLDRNVGPKEMHAFRTLLAATDLACYSAIINTLIRAEFDYLWVKFLQESPSLLKKLRYPQSPESRFFRILFTENRLAEIISNAKPVEVRVREKVKIEQELPPPQPIVDQATDRLIAEPPFVEIKKITEIQVPAMHFTIDQRTGVVMPPKGWKMPDRCRLAGDFWYLENGQKKPLSLSDNRFEQKSLKEIVFFDEGGQEFYGTICFKVTLTASQGSVFSSGDSSISSRELSFTKLRLLEAPAMTFTIDEKTGVVKVPEGWTLPEGCTISWKVEYRGKNGKELSQSKDFAINNRILDISYKDGEQEVYDKKIYVIITLTAPQGSVFSSGDSSISSRELSCFRNAPDVELRTLPSQPTSTTSILSQSTLATTERVASVIVMSPEQEASELWEMALESSEFSVQIAGEDRVDIILNPSVHLEGKAAKYNTITAQMSGDSITYSPDNLGQRLYQALAEIIKTTLAHHTDQKKKLEQALSIQRQEEKIRKEYSFIIQSISDFVGRITQDTSLSVDGLSDILKTGERGNIFIWEKGGNVYVRFPKACIMQFNLHSNSVSVVQDGTCKLGEEFSVDMVVLAKILLPDIAFIYADKIRKGNRQKMLHSVKERREAMPIYMDALSRGTARLMILPKGYHNKEQKGLPLGELPRVEKNISWDNIDIRIAELLLQYPGCTIECCLIKDALQINGAISQADPLEIAKSSRGMHIMRKRILITLGLITTADKDRTSIQPPGSKILADNHPYSVLKTLDGFDSIKTAGDLTDTFIISYLQALKEAGIKVYYTHPYTLSRAAFTRPTTAAQ